MNTDLGTKLLEDYHRGGLSRREVVARLVGLGAAMAVSGNAAAEGTTATSTFAGTRVGHIALDVTDVARSHAFEEEYLGLRTMGDGGDQRSFLAPVGGQFIPALLRSDAHHYCHTIPEYNPDDVVVKLLDAGVEPRCEGAACTSPTLTDLPCNWRRGRTIDSKHPVPAPSAGR